MELQLNNENSVKIALRERIYKNSTTEPSVIVKIPNNENVVVVGDKPFDFDYILSESQEELFLKLGKPLVDKTLFGFNTTCLAYGQTGTGKTYSMGLNHFDYNDKLNFGIIPRSVEEVFNNINNENILNSNEIMVSISYVEIYNEKVYDMFAENHLEQINVKGCRFVGGVKKEINSANDAFALLKKGNQIRHVRPTKLNGSSSRSHAVFTIHILRNSTSSCLNLVDLAGSEGIRRTGHQGIAREEGVNINQGLLSIGKVLHAIITKSSVIPFRDSVLTTVLQSSLNCDSYFTLLSCVSPLKEDLSETLATLRFAQNAKRLKNDPKLNNLLNSLKKTHTSTPLNLFKRASNLQSNKLPLRSNTFSTPNKLPMISHKFNNSESTVKRRQNFKDIIPPSKKNVFSDTRDSNISFNMSTSTAIEVPITQSYSPIVRKCFLEYESKMKEELNTFVKSIVAKENNSTLRGPPKSSTPVMTSSNDMPWSEIRSEIKDRVRKEMTSIIFQRPQDELNNYDDYNESIDLYNLDEDIGTSFKTLHQTKSKTINRNNGISPRLKSIQLRRSARLSSISAEPSVIDIPRTLRRSVRLSSMSCINDFTPTEIPKNLRRSVRLSYSNNNRPDSSISNKPRKLRRSIRIAPKIIEESVVIEKLSTINKTKQRTQNLYEKNLLKLNKNTNKNSNLKKEHNNNILKLLNTGTMKELTILPQIGLKTAYQIVSYRTLNGIFKDFEHMSALPFWRGTAWERFKNANHID